MSSEDGTPYIIPQTVGPDDEWVSPAPAETVITDALVAAGDLEPDDVDDLWSHVDVSSLTAVLEGETESLSFTVDGHEVVVASDGSIDVSVE